jgi:hypothetical protein
MVRNPLRVGLEKSWLIARIGCRDSSNYGLGMTHKCLIGFENPSGLQFQV